MKYRYLILLIILVSCEKNTVYQITYESIAPLSKVQTYKMNAVIKYYYDQTQDGGNASTDYSYVSEHRSLIDALTRNDTIKTISNNTLLDIQKKYKPLNAIDYIISESKNHEILMLNEDHAIPQHRNFLSQLLPELYANGYRNLGLEGLSNYKRYEDEIRKKCYPSTKHGPYIKEPEYGNLIRKARKLGFNVFGYSGSGEEASAQNILNYMNSTAGKGKTVTLSGWDHIKEGHTGTYWEYAIAGNIKKLSGLDPLTINQTQYFEKASRIYEDSLYQTQNFKNPTVLVDKQNKSLDLEEDPGWYDVFIFHPRTKFIEEIPNWILINKKIEKFEIPIIEIECPCKVLLFEITDDVQVAVPTYMIEIADLKKSVRMPVNENTNYKILIANEHKAYVVE